MIINTYTLSLKNNELIQHKSYLEKDIDLLEKEAINILNKYKNNTLFIRQKDNIYKNIIIHYINDNNEIIQHIITKTY